MRRIETAAPTTPTSTSYKRVLHGAILGLAAGVGFGILVATPDHTEAVVPQCALWADTQHPELPANSVQGACIGSDGVVYLDGEG